MERNHILLFDKNEILKRIINEHEFFDDEVKSTVTGERTFNFKIKDNIEIKNGDKVGIFIKNKFDLFVVEQIEAETYFSTTTKVMCLHDFYSIQEEKVITNYYKESTSIRESVTDILSNTSYVLGKCVERNLQPIGPYLFKNPLWCIRDIISVFGVEIDYNIELNENRTEISKKVLNVVNALGSDTGIRCSTDLNVSKIKRIEKDEFYTVLYGCGAEYQKDYVKYKYDFKNISWETPNNPVNKPLGQEYVEDPEAVSKYGRKIGIYEDGRVKDPELLLKKTWEALKRNNKPISNYEVSIEELRIDKGYEHLDFKLGDIIILQNTIDDSRARFRIIEDSHQIRANGKRKITIGEQLKSLTSGDSNTGGSIVPPGGDIPSIPDIEDIAPDTLPDVPIVTATGLWAKVDLSWTYENKMYYTYEVYASQIKDFEPTVFNMIYSGKASAFLHEVEANQTWYYRVRAINTYGNTTPFSEQVEATTTKVSDATEFFESAAIKDALIETLRLDRGWVGELKGNYIDAKNLSVSDGNNNKTLFIDSFGNVHLQATTFKLQGKDIDYIFNESFGKLNQNDIFNVLTNNGRNQGIYLLNGRIYLNGEFLKAHSISVNSLSSNNENPIITLFGQCAIDATYRYGVGQGNAIRFKWDDYNYIKISDGKISFFSEDMPEVEILEIISDGSSTTIVTPFGNLNFSSDGIRYKNRRLAFADEL